MTHTPKPWSDQETAEALRQARDFMSLPLNALAMSRAVGHWVPQLLAHIERVEEHRRRLFEALEMLSNEVGGLGAFEIEIRVATGNTNWAVLTQRRQEAVSLLEELCPHVAPGGVA